MNNENVVGLTDFKILIDGEVYENVEPVELELKEEQEISADELIGYIMRRADESDLNCRLDYEEVLFILKAGKEFMEEKGIAE